MPDNEDTLVLPDKLPLAVSPGSAEISEPILPDRVSPLESTYKETADLEPDHAAKVISLAGQTGEAEVFVANNLPAVEKAVNAPPSSFWGELEKEYPGTAKFLQEPKNMAVAKDDFDNLALHERIIKEASTGWKRNTLEIKLSRLASEQLSETTKNGTFSTKNDEEILAVEKELEPFYKGEPKGFHPMYFAASQGANWIQGGAKGLTRAAQLAPLGFAAGAAVGSVTGPGAVATGVAGAGIAAKAGFALGAGEFAYTMEAGLAFNEYKKITDKNGVPIEPVVAAKAARTVGLVNAALEATGELILFHGVAKPMGKTAMAALSKIPGSDKIVGVIAQNPKVFANMTMSKAIRKAGLMLVTMEAGEVSTEYLQEINTGFGAERAKAADGWGDFEEKPAGQILKEGTGVINPVAQGVLIPGMFGGSLHVYNAQASIRQAEQTKQVYEAIGDTAEASKLRKRMPEAHRKFIEDAVKDSPVENVFIPAEAFETYFQSKNIDPATVASELGISEQYAQEKAVDTGGDLQIPLATWVDKVAGSEHYKGLSEDIKFSPEGNTPRQAKEMQSTVDEQMGAEQEKAKEGVQKQAQDSQEYDQAYRFYKVEQEKAGNTTKMKAKEFGKLVEGNAKIAAKAAVVEAKARGISVNELLTGQPLEVKSGLRPDVPVVNEIPKVGDTDAKTIIEQAGGVFKGVQKGSADLKLPDLVVFDNPNKHEGLNASDTLTVPLSELTAEKVKQAIEANDKTYMQPANRDVDPARLVPILKLKHTSETMTAQQLMDKLAEQIGTGKEINTADKEYFMKLLPKSVKHMVWSSGPVSRSSMPVRNAGIMSIRKLIEHSTLIESVPNMKPEAKGDVVVYHRFYVPVSLDGHIYTIRLVAQEKKGNISFDRKGVELYDVIEDKTKQPLPHSQPAGEPAATLKAGEEAVSKISIQQMLSNVKDYFGGPLFQGEADPRGFIQFSPDNKKAVIHLLKADASTFMHEMAHKWLNDKFQFVLSGQAGEAYLKEWAAIKEWLKIEEGQDKLNTDQQEKFAKGFEAYLAEGKAPSEGLRRVFNQFRRWMTKVYKDIGALQVEVSPEIKEIFDRMLATEEEISHAERELGFANDLDFSKLPKEIAEKVKQFQLQAHDEAVALLYGQQLENMTTKKKEYKEALAKATKEAQDYVANQPIYKVMKEYEKKLGDDARAAAVQFVKKKLPAEKLEQFESFAEKQGYSCGDEMAQAMLKKRNDEEYAKYIVNLNMANFFDMEKIKEEAMRIVHSEKQLELLAYEKAILEELLFRAEVNIRVREAKRERVSSEAGMARQTAMDKLYSRPVKEATAYVPYFTAERNAAMKAVEAMGKDDMKRAAKYKGQQMMNHALSSQALKNSKEADRIVKSFEKYRERGGELRHMPYGFVRQIDGLLSRFGLKSSPGEDSDSLLKLAKDMDEKGEGAQDIATATGWLRDEKGQWKQENLPEFIERVKENYYTLSLPETLLGSGEKPFSSVTMGELKDIKQAVDAIGKIGRQYERFLSDFIKGDIKEAAKKASISISLEIGQKYKEQLAAGHKHSSELMEKLDSVLKLPDAVIGDMVNLLTLCKYLDGGKEDGPMQNYVYRPLKMAEDRKLAKYEKMTKDINGLFKKYFTEKELAGYKVERKFFENIDQNSGRYFTREEILSMALNWGNEGNKDRIMRGFKLGETQVERILGTLEVKEWDFVQDVWNYLETFWPDIAGLEMKVSGRAPDKVQATKITRSWGSYEGGYYPIAYDFDKSAQAYNNTEQKNALYKQYSSAAAHTDHGHTKARVDSLKRPVRLELGVLFSHLENVVHDVAFRPVIIDVNRFLSTAEVRDAVENAIGVKGYRAMTESLKSVASDQGEFLTSMDKVFRWFRFNTTFATLAYRLFSFPMDITGNIINTVWTIGPRRFSKAVSDFAVDPAAGIAFVQSKSERMRLRSTMRDRDLMEISKKWQGKDSAFKRYGFIIQSMADQALSYPLWMEVYKHSLEQYGDEKAKNMADEAVTRTMGSGSILDQAGGQRGSEAKKILSMYYSWLGNMFNKVWLEGKLAGLEYDKGNTSKAIQMMAKTTLFAWVLQGANEAFWREIIRNTPDGGDDEERKKRIWSRILVQPFSYIWVLNNFAGYGVDRALGRRYADTKIPLQGAAESIINPLADGARIAFTDKELDLKYFEEIARAGAIIGGYPQQINNLVFNFMDWLSGEGEITWRDIVARRTKT
jgi:hypothetical protein